MGGGGFSMEPDNPLLDQHVVASTGKARPRICFVPTASGDSERYLVGFYTAFSQRAEATHLPLFRRDTRALRELLISQHAIYVGGGNTANMLAVWRAHGVDAILREAYDAGVLLCGLSAGAICWFESSVTDSFGGMAPLQDGLALLPGSFCPHFDGEADRRPTYHQLVAEGALPAGYAADDGAALFFEDGALTDIVTSRPRAAAYRVERVHDGAVERRLDGRDLSTATR